MTDHPLDSPAVSLQLDGEIAVIRIDDGKANALTHEIIASVQEALRVARTETKAVVLLGREGKLCAGFDLSVMKSGMNEARDLLKAGAELGAAFYTAPIPVVIGATGHALAMGAILLFCADVRIGAEGPFKIGMNEVAIGMPVPRFAITLAADRLSKRHLTAAVGLATVYDPAGAVDAGYLDRLVAPDAVEATAIETAKELAGRLHPAAFRLTREYFRGETAHATQTAFDLDYTTFTVAE